MDKVKLLDETASQISCQCPFNRKPAVNTLPADKGHASVLYSVHPVNYFQATCKQEVKKFILNICPPKFLCLFYAAYHLNY